MIQYITRFLSDMEPRAIPPYQLFLKSQRKFIYERYHRLMSSQGHEANGIRLMRYILQFADLNYLDQQVNLYDAYSYHVRHIRKDLNYTFDRIARGRGVFNVFFRKDQFATEEFIFPIEDVNSLVNLPLYTWDWQIWKKVRPLRLWTHNSDEFTTNIINDTLHYKGMPPSYAVFLLDVVALVFKYYVWLRMESKNEEARELVLHIPQQYFLHKYVMCDLVWDMGNIWLLRQMNRVYRIQDKNDLKTFDNRSLQYDIQYGRISTDSHRGFEALWEVANDTKRNLRPEAFLSSKTLFGGSINDRIRLADDRLVLPIQSQYDYLRWLRDRDLFELFLKIWSNRKDLPKAKTIRVNVERDMKRLILKRPWNVCQSTLLKREIEQQIVGLTNYL